MCCFKGRGNLAGASLNLVFGSHEPEDTAVTVYMLLLSRSEFFCWCFSLTDDDSSINSGR